MAEWTHVKGLSELQTFLDQIAPKLQKNVMRGALRAGMKVVQEDAKASASFADKTGELRKGLKISTDSKGATVKSSLKVKGKHGYVAKFIEFGTAPHIIKAKEGSALSFGGGALQHVDHPGAKARPFMRPALDAKSSDAVVAAAEYIKDKLSTKHGLDTSDVDVVVTK